MFETTGVDTYLHVPYWDIGNIDAACKKAAGERFKVCAETHVVQRAHGPLMIARTCPMLVVPVRVQVTQFTPEPGRKYVGVLTQINGDGTALALLNGIVVTLVENIPEHMRLGAGMLVQLECMAVYKSGLGTQCVSIFVKNKDEYNAFDILR